MAQSLNGAIERTSLSPICCKNHLPNLGRIGTRRRIRSLIESVVGDGDEHADDKQINGNSDSRMLERQVKQDINQVKDDRRSAVVAAGSTTSTTSAPTTRIRLAATDPCVNRNSSDKQCRGCAEQDEQPPCESIQCMKAIHARPPTLGDE